MPNNMRSTANKVKDLLGSQLNSLVDCSIREKYHYHDTVQLIKSFNFDDELKEYIQKNDDIPSDTIQSVMESVLTYMPSESSLLPNEIKSIREHGIEWWSEVISKDITKKMGFG